MSKCNHDHPHDHDHSHAHDHHAHGHGHHHHHHAGQRVGVAFFLNLFFAIIELVGGMMTNSMAIMSDALHDFGDSLALGMAWWLENKSQKKSDGLFTYGYRRLSLMSAVITGVILTSGSIWIISRAIPRLLHPEPVQTQGMLGLAVFGIVINGLGFWQLSKGDSMNEKVLSWHFIEDLSGWVVVLIGAVVMMFVDWPWIDPLMALLLSIWIGWNVIRHLRKTVGVFLQISPEHLRRGEAENWMKTLSGVQDVHHSHIWSLDGSSHIMTAHVVVRDSSDASLLRELKKQIKEGLSKKFGILEATIEFESGEESCLDPRHG